MIQINWKSGFDDGVRDYLVRSRAPTVADAPLEALGVGADLSCLAELERWEDASKGSKPPSAAVRLKLRYGP